MSATHPNLALIHSFFQAYATNDLDGIKKIVAEDIKWHDDVHVQQKFVHVYNYLRDTLLSLQASGHSSAKRNKEGRE